MFYKSLCVLLLSLILSQQATAFDFPELSKEQKVIAVNAGFMGFITAWGVTKWDYFTRSPSMQSEGWFDKDTADGGADKIGHLWSTYAFADGLAHLYEGWGYEPDKAALNGALSSFAIMGFMELGDSFSRYGFSYEDMIMNTVGAASSYLLYKYPGLDRKIDLRWEYAPKFDTGDIFTDYENTKYLIAVQLDGFRQMENTPLSWLELHLGYYARGYDPRREDRNRHVYAGVGLNVGKLFSKMGCGSFCNMFHYYQPPYTYLATD
jgi:hypothetical protein